TNEDLIYGLPHQNRESFNHTLEEVLKTDPSRLSIFNYAHLASRFAAHHKLKVADLPAPLEKLAMLHDTIAFLTGQGYQFMGMDHFAKRDVELAVAQREGKLHRNFQVYS
ncbi:oxygen-independent coproporphyrinogen III oxidase, partial [Aeromonas caviae]|nr:oxygen-independent coproporphyrinogen III oxidase [Aeromonas caviae]